MAEETKEPDVNVQTTEGSQALDIQQTTPAKVDPSADTTTPETLGVNQAQFDKFYDAKVRAYNWEGHAKELAWQMSQKGGTAKPVAPPQDATEAKAQAAIDEAGLDIDALNAELAENGKLGAETLAALKAKGIPEETAQGYARYIVDTANNFVAEVKTYLGGDEGIATLKAWALKNLEPSEIQLYEKKLSDPAEWKVYADSIKTRAGVRSGTPAAIVQGGNAQGGANSGTTPYGDMAELTADQRNPKYRTDPKFRANVMARARASTFDVPKRQMIAN
jgi:hypothetical protein